LRLFALKGAEDIDMGRLLSKGVSTFYFVVQGITFAFPEMGSLLSKYII